MVQGSLVGTESPKHRNVDRNKQRSDEGVYHREVEPLNAVGYESDLGDVGHSTTTGSEQARVECSSQD